MNEHAKRNGTSRWIAVIALGALWVVHAWLESRSAARRDPRLVHARERRGF